MKKRYDVVIAGAGIAGLSLAALLASGGKASVLLVEKQDNVGGRFRVEERDGYLVDWGVHACLLGSRGAIAAVLKSAGKKVPIPAVGASIWDGKRAVPLLGKRLSSLVSQRAVPLPDFALLGFEALKMRRDNKRFEVSVEDWCREKNASDNLRRLVESLCTGLMPTGRYDRASMGEILDFLIVAGVRMRAMGYPGGGWSSVLDALRQKVEKAPSCELAPGTALERVVTSGGKVTSAVVGGQEVAARSVVCAFPPQEMAAPGFVSPGLEDSYRRKLLSLEGGSGLCIDMGLKRPVTEDSRIIMSPNPPALLWAVSNVSSEVAPKGRQLLQLFSPLEEGEARSGDIVDERKEMLLLLAHKVFKSDLHEEWKRVMVTPVVSVVPYTTQGRPSRPAIAVPSVKGLFLIGDGVGVPGLGGELAARSALEALPQIVRYLEL